MKVIQLPNMFIQGDGYPLLLGTRDKQGRFVPQKVDGVEVRDAQGNILAESHEATFVETAHWFLNEIFRLAQRDAEDARLARKDPPKEFTHEESGYALDIHRALNVMVDGRLELEKAPFEWLEEQLKKWGVRVLRCEAAVLREPFLKVVEVEPTRGEKRREEREEAKAAKKELRVAAHNSTLHKGQEE